MKHKDLLQEELIKRKSNFDLNKVESLWSVYEVLKKQKSEYDQKREEISRELANILKNEPNSDTAEKLKIQINLVKDNIKKLKMPLWSAEEAAMIEALKLPNCLHAQTPENKNNVVYTFLNPPASKKAHLIIGKERNIIYFKKNENYYLKGDAAIFELGAKFYFSNILKNNKFIQFSNPDFVKSLIVEGCGLDHTNPDYSFIIHHNEDTDVNTNSRFHLTGGGSLCSFLAYYAKNVVYSKALPLKYFAMGRQYVPSPSTEDSLFNVSQASVVQIFGATKTSQDLDCMLKEIIGILKQAYEPLGYHFQISILSAEKLSLCESLRVVVEMYSSSLGQYIEVANVSLSGDFISKRLMFTYLDNKKHEFPHLLSGTLLNVPKFLACVLEQDEEFVLPRLFKVDRWTA